MGYLSGYFLLLTTDELNHISYIYSIHIMVSIPSCLAMPSSVLSKPNDIHIYICTYPPIMPILLIDVSLETQTRFASTSKAPRLRGSILQRQRTQGSWQSFAYWFLDFGNASSRLENWTILAGIIHVVWSIQNLSDINVVLGQRDMHLAMFTYTYIYTWYDDYKIITTEIKIRYACTSTEKQKKNKTTLI